jgi:hypothetical protein
MAIKHTSIFYCKTLQKFTQIGIFGLKICHLATPELERREATRPDHTPDFAFYLEKLTTGFFVYEKEN